MVVISSRPTSIIFLSATAAPIPLFTQILVIFGTCMTDLYLNLSFKAGTISLLYFSFSLGVAMALLLSRFYKLSCLPGEALKLALVVELAPYLCRLTCCRIQQHDIADVDRCLGLLDTAFRFSCGRLL